MPIALNVKADIRQVEKMLGRLKKGGPRIVARALNETAKTAQSLAIKDTAKEIRLPRKFVAWRFTQDGKRKGDRSTIRKAYPTRLTVVLNVHMRGIPVFQIANKAPPIGKQRKGGVKAKGGRFYKGAFYAPVAGGMRVFKRKTRARHPLMLPKVGVRQRLDRKFRNNTQGRQGRARFRSSYERLIEVEIRRASATG